ncbi:MULTISPECIES: PAS domain S-box protein [unclassified Brevundimonas]|uniref:hybrid sensor histidine kinase/response regulator n=1 Tax=unclassified Brevundimonas TaxID=2622653 RepID=UPI003F8E3F0D
MAKSPTDDRYRLLIESITDYAIYMLDTDGRITSWNPGARRFKGYEADEIIGENFARFYTGEDRARDLPRKALARAVEEGRFEAEGWRIRKDGTRLWAHVVIDPVRSPEGELLGFAKITRDLTERMQAQEALRKTQEQLRMLVQGVTDYAIYMLGRQGEIMSWNAGAERIKGYRPEEIIGDHFSRFYTPEDQAGGAPRRNLEIAASEGRFETEGWRVRNGGDRFWAHVVIDAIRNEQNDVIGFAKVTRDITARLEQERELAATREALFQSQKIEAVGQLTGGVAHDFNNLLAAILGSLELVRKRISDDPRVTPLLENAIKAAERGTALTERMLAFARKQELKIETVDLPDLVGGMLEFLQRTIGGPIEVGLSLPPDLPPVLTDPCQLEAAILNLAVNARDAMPGGGKVTVSARREHAARATSGLAAGDYVVLSVADNGAGMAPETLARATEPFFTTKGVGKGTGLGLSMVHGLAAQAGGAVVLESKLDRGTTVHLWLPVADSEQQRRGHVVRSPESATVSTGRTTILVVDDDDLVLVNTTAMLDDLGHAVIAARSGAEALRALGNRPDIDLIVTDEMMPGMTGSELAAAVRQRRPDLPVLLATGYADLDPDSSALRVSLPRLSKPFSQAQLAKAVAATMA